MHYRIYLFIYLGYLDRLAHFSFKASWTTPDHNTGSNALYSFQEGIGFYQSPANQHWEDTGDEAYHSLSLNKKRQKCLDIFGCQSKDSTFSAPILRPWKLVQLRVELWTSCSTTWTNQAWYIPLSFYFQGLKIHPPPLFYNQPSKMNTTKTRLFK